MFERFTDRARRVVVLSQENAHIRHQPYIAVQNILIALYDEGEGVAAIVLKESAFPRDDEKYKKLWEEDAPTKGHLPFTGSTKKVLELSLREALQLGHNYIGTEHVLLALIRTNDEHGLIDWITPSELRKAVIQKLSGYTHQPNTATPRERLVAILRSNVAPNLLMETVSAVLAWHEGELPEAG